MGGSLFVFCHCRVPLLLYCCLKGLFIHSVQIYWCCSDRVITYKVSLMKIMSNVSASLETEAVSTNSPLRIQLRIASEYNINYLGHTLETVSRLWLSCTLLLLLILLLEWCSLFGIMVKLRNFLLQHLNNIRASRNGTRLITILPSHSWSSFLSPVTRLASCSGVSRNRKVRRPLTVAGKNVHVASVTLLHATRNNKCSNITLCSNEQQHNCGGTGWRWRMDYSSSRA